VTSSETSGGVHAHATVVDGAGAGGVTGSETSGGVHAHPTVVVDELALVRLGLTSLLAGLDAEVALETPSGREAAEQLPGLPADLVVIGVPADMPVVEAVRRARAARESVLIVALLGAGQVGSVAAVVDAGADGVGLRGALPADLNDVLRAVLSGGRYVASTLSSGLVGQLETVEPSAGDDDHDLLTYREREVLALLAGGATNREIAATLSVTLATVKSHLVHVYAKLEVRNRHEALSRAVALGLLA
jgi:DNA-binding NarL/FixJ family response regulator